MHFYKKMIRQKFGCKRPSMLKVIAPYATTTELKLARCQPRAQTTKISKILLNVFQQNSKSHFHLAVFMLSNCIPQIKSFV